MTLANQILCQIRHHSLRSTIELRWHALEERCNLCNPQPRVKGAVSHARQPAGSAASCSNVGAWIAVAPDCCQFASGAGKLQSAAMSSLPRVAALTRERVAREFDD